MLPANPYRPNRPKRPRPISAADTVATTGLTVNPNGTFISPPSTAQNGMQGQYGAMLPTNAPQGSLLPPVQVATPGQTFHYNQTGEFGVIQQKTVNTPGTFQSSQPWMNMSWNPAVTNLRNTLPGSEGARPTGQAPNRATAPSSPYQDRFEQMNDQRGTSGTPGSMDDYFFRNREQQTQVMNAVLAGLDAGDMSVLSMIPASDLEAMGLGDIAATTGNGGTISEPTDFQQTKAYKFNQENNIPFLQQKRWDEQRKKYISVGQWMKQERRKFNKKGRYVGDNRGGKKKTPAAPTTPTPTGESITANFNTGTG